MILFATVAASAELAGLVAAALGLVKVLEKTYDHQAGKRERRRTEENGGDPLNSIRAIESDIQLIDQLKSLVTDNQFAWAANLIGKHVTGLSTTNDPVEGRVVSVVRQGEDVSLELDNGWLVPIGSVQTVTEAVP